jgi:hypothetical protein
MLHILKNRIRKFYLVGMSRLSINIYNLDHSETLRISGPQSSKNFKVSEKSVKVCSACLQNYKEQ